MLPPGIDRAVLTVTVLGLLLFVAALVVVGFSFVGVVRVLGGT